MKVCVFFVSLVAFLLSDGQAVIIPDELPSILSLIYSNIPTLKKGTDSRLGWGFRLGDRADFQVLVELGPQQNTQPLANQGDSGANKRNIQNNLVNTLYARAQAQKQKNTISNSEGGKFIDQWSKDMGGANQQQEPIDEFTSGAEPSRITLGLGEVLAEDVIADDSVVALEELYGKKAPTTAKPKTSTSYKDALDNVDFD